MVVGEFHNKPLLDFIHDMEKQGVHFDYVHQLVEDIKLNGILPNKVSLEEALIKLLAHTNITYAVTKEGSFVLFKDPNKVMKQPEKRFTVSGVVIDKSGNPIPFASLYLFDQSKGVIANEEGIFEIGLVLRGVHTLQASVVNYNTEIRVVDVQGDMKISLEMTEMATQLEELIITPGAFSISTVEAPLTLSKEEILHSPNMSKDIYRTLKALPGIASNDFSAKARIRGGHSDETGVYLDHFLINEPFHLEEVDGSFSIFNTDYIEELNVLMGGFGATYTDKLSGMLDVKTADYSVADQYKFSIDLLNAGIMVQKKLSSKTELFVTARRGYLDFLLGQMEDDTDELLPRFSDIWSKLSWNLNEKNSFTYNFLMGHDNFMLHETDDVSASLDLQNVRNNINQWINWKWFPSSEFSAITSVGFQRMTKRADFAFQDNLTEDNVDKNHTNTLVFTNNSYWNVSKAGTLEAGFEFKTFNSAYDYEEVRVDVFNSTPDNVHIDTLNIHEDFGGYTFSGYSQFSWKPLPGLVVQPGIRASAQKFSPEVKWAPRFAVSYLLAGKLNFKLAYGIYYQPDNYYKLRTALGQTEPYAYNAKSIHYTGSVIWSLPKTDIQANVYYKDNQRLYDDYRFEFFNRLGGVSLLDIPFGTTSGHSKGMEVMVRRNYGKSSMISISYAYAINKIRNPSGEETYRDFDQRHTIIVNNMFRLPKNWNISFLWNFHSGNPYTKMDVAFVGVEEETNKAVIFYNPQKKNGEQLPDFRTLDLRMEKTWYFKRNYLTVYLNIVNLFNRENIRSYIYYPYRDKNGNLNVEYNNQTGIPFFISPGISYTIR